MYQSFCMAIKSNFPHAYLMEHFRCMFCSVVHPSDSMQSDYKRPRKNPLSFQAVLLSCNTSTVLKFCHSHPSLPLEVLLLFTIICNNHGLTAFFHLQFKSHGDFPKL